MLRKILCFFGFHSYGPWITNPPYLQLRFCRDKRCNRGKSRYYGFG